MNSENASNPGPSKNRILGIDPGLRVCGFAVIEVGTNSKQGSNFQTDSLRVIEAGVVRVPENQEISQRLRYLKNSIDEIISDLHPSEMAIERLFAHYQRSQPAILMGHARGVILLAAGEKDIPVKGYPATTVKKMVAGHGRAPKEQMQQAICQHLGLSKAPEPHDVADALSIAMCHYFLTYTARSEDPLSTES